MTTFTTITEKELLYAAWFTLLDRRNTAYDHLQQNPNNPYTKARFEKIDAKYNEIHNRILELEAVEREGKNEKK